MKKRYLVAVCLVILCFLLFSSIFKPIVLTQSTSAQTATVTISAAISLKDALEEIKTQYQKKDSKVSITYNFGSSGSLQQQIEQGAPVDIFISAANKQMDALESKNLLLAGTRRTLVTNQLVLVTPKSEKKLTQFQDLTKPFVTKIALGEPKSVPAGQYGEEVLKYFKILDSVKPKIIYGKDVRQVLTYVQTGNVNAGLVYQTDAKTADQVRVAAIAPKASHRPIVYPLAILKDTKNPQRAKAFSQFLTSKTSQSIFKKYGFGL
ncbi:MAG: molybdate ABC transporter substrate-binding protein [Snowella sp.]|nr:molybdate ABC transporter substrate-binding protein [Snowella sp.]